jgi:predicted phosphodiesterase
MTLPRFRRVAVLSDVHGNAEAMAAVAEAVLAEQPDALVLCGDLTWGSQPEETWALIGDLRERIGGPSFLVRGNAERSLAELRAGTQQKEPRERELWMLAHHSAATLDALETFETTVGLDVEGLGPTRFCHGSPRSDEELITTRTPEARINALMQNVAERVLVSAHTHIQFDRRVAGIRSINAGSVGLPYMGATGAFWALLGPDVDLRRTAYDLEAATAAYRATDDPLAEQMVEMLLDAPTLEQVVEHAETVEFSG